MVKVLHDGEKYNFEFQVKTNERLYKLQKQIDERKQRSENNEKQLQKDLHTSVENLRIKVERELKAHENQLNTNSMFLEGQIERLTNFMQKSAAVDEDFDLKLQSLIQRINSTDDVLKQSVTELQSLIDERTQIEIGEIELPPEEEDEVKLGTDAQVKPPNEATDQ